MRFKVESDHVVSEAIDGEVVAIDLASGYYFSLTGAGVEVWRLVEQSATHDEIVEGLMRRYQGNRADMTDAVHQLLDQLQRARLVISVEDDGAPATVLPAAVAECIPFVPPQLETYTDMSEIIRMDPIHDVDPELGWPHPRSS
ncbi:MAG: PqqD family protein [Chloroflexi bacterium]|nr:MAG: PqqD family protein [Chloroflexota bacterium]